MRAETRLSLFLSVCCTQKELCIKFGYNAIVHKTINVAQIAISSKKKTTENERKKESELCERMSDRGRGAVKRDQGHTHTYNVK